MDQTTSLITMGVILSILLAAWIARNATLGVQTFFGTLLPLLIFAAFLISIRAVEVTDTQVIVRRRLGSKRYNLADIKRVQILEKDGLNASIRTFGSGGLFGSIGRFWHREHGQLRVNSNRRGRHIMLYTARQKVVFSANDIDGLAAIIERRIEQGVSG